MTAFTAPAPHRGGAVTFRPGQAADLEACSRVWKSAIDDYQARLNQPPLPGDQAHLRRLLAHLLETDPDRFWVAMDRAGVGVDPSGASRSPSLIGFSSAAVRDGLWFLAMLFVEPRLQASGLGKALMDRAQAGRDVDPGGPRVPGPDDPLDTGIHTWGMCTDSAQPIANALYAGRGMVPRVPIWRVSGEIRRWTALPRPPAGTEIVRFDILEAEGPDGARRLAGLLDDLDHEVIGIAHAADHRYLRRDGRAGFLLRETGGRPLGYTYGSSTGRLGPVAATDPALHPALLRIALREALVPGPAAIWVPGTADRAMRALLAAGMRLDGFPGLICWSRAAHPFERYLPISLAVV